MTPGHGLDLARPHALVTGATGGVGRALVQELRQAGWDLTLVARHPATLGDLPVHGVDLRVEVPRIDRPLDAVAHLAATVPHGPGVDAEAEGNLAMMDAVLRLAVEHKAAVSYAASAYVHDPMTGAPIAESTPLRVTSPYQASKRAGEVRLAEHADHTGLPAASLRVAAPYGRGMRHHTVLTHFIEAARAGQTLGVHGSGNRRQDFVHVRDVARAFRLALERRVTGVWLVGSGHSIAMRDLAHAIVRLTPGSNSAVISSGQPDPQEGYDWHFDVRAAAADLGFRATVPLDVGLMDLISDRAAP